MLLGSACLLGSRSCHTVGEETEALHSKMLLLKHELKPTVTSLLTM